MLSHAERVYSNAAGAEQTQSAAWTIMSHWYKQSTGLLAVPQNNKTLVLNSCVFYYTVKIRQFDFDYWASWSGQSQAFV